MIPRFSPSEAACVRSLAPPCAYLKIHQGHGPDRRAVARGCRKALHGRCPVLIMVRPLRMSPGRWGLAGGLPEMLAQVRLVGETAPQRNVTQGRIGRKHILSG